MKRIGNIRKKSIIILAITVIGITAATIGTIMVINADRDKELSYEETLALYNEGYGVNDIQRAHDLSVETGKDIREILKMKGKTVDEVNANADKITGKGNGTKDVANGKNWDDVEKELGVNTENEWERQGISITEKDELGRHGFDERQVIEIGQILSNYGFKYEEVKDDIFNCTYIFEINEKMLDKAIADKSDDERTKIKNDFNDVKIKMESKLKLDNNITAEDESLFESKGIKDITDMIYLKNVSNKENKSLSDECDQLKSSREKIKTSEYKVKEVKAQ